MEIRRWLRDDDDYDSDPRDPGWRLVFADKDSFQSWTPEYTILTIH
jgi:hypothetical protein